MSQTHLMYSKACKNVMLLYLRDHYPPEEAEKLMKAAQQKYREFLKDVPYMGGKSNGQAQSVYDCIGLFAFYEVLPQELSLEVFENLVSQIFVTAYDRVSFANMNRKPLQKLAARIFSFLAKKGQDHADRWPGNYQMYARPYDPGTGVHFGYTRCPIADFAKTHGYTHLMPAMCNPDYPALAKIHAALIRTKTCAEDECCDYWILGDQSPLLKEHPRYRDEKGYLRNR